MLHKLVLGSRSKRSFMPDKGIPYDILKGLCDTARNCPAAMNMQPLKYKIVQDDEEIAALLGITRWATALEKKFPPENHTPTAFIVICHDKDIVEEKPIFMIDVGIVAQTMMLAAHEKGYGGCIIGSAGSDVIKETLSLPENLVPKLILGLGVPDEQVVLTEATDGQVKYYRDSNDIHYVPKRPLDEIIIK